MVQKIRDLVISPSLPFVTALNKSIMSKIIKAIGTIIFIIKTM